MRYFTGGELALWGGSVTLIVTAHLVCGNGGAWELAASLIGVTSLIFCAKGNPIGQALMVLFSLIYGGISWGFCYYGEMITYLGMSMPMAVLSLIAWLRHPYRGDRSQVAVGRLTARSWLLAAVLTVLVTGIFYVILAALDTANLLPSTVSVATSFLAVYLTCRRSPYFALAYAANDVVLILLWALASQTDDSYVSVVVCFVAFLINDVYGFISWRRMARRQSAETEAAHTA